MDPEDIDWKNIESKFIEDEKYENFNAPQWVDLSAPDEAIDDVVWFCSSHCKHRKTAEDFVKSSRISKLKILRSVSISEILPLRNRIPREAKSLQKISENAENRNPNEKTERKRVDVSDDLSIHGRKPRLRSTFSSRNLIGGREIFSQITEFCSELKKLASKSSKKEGKVGGKVLCELKERVRDRERAPLLVKEEIQRK